MKKSVQHIMILILSLVTMYLGTGVSFVHICSSYCMQRQQNAPEAQEGCCAHHYSDTCPGAQQLCAHIRTHSSCSCLDVTLQIDFFNSLSQQVFHWLSQLPVDLPIQLAVPQSPVTEHKILVQAPNAPPVESGRELLAFHSILII